MVCTRSDVCIRLATDRIFKMYKIGRLIRVQRANLSQAPATTCRFLWRTHSCVQRSHSCERIAKEFLHAMSADPVCVAQALLPAAPRLISAHANLVKNIRRDARSEERRVGKECRSRW